MIGEVSLEEDSALSLTVGDQVKSTKIEATKDFGTYVEKPLGTFNIDTAGDYNISIKPDGKNWTPINLRGLHLRLK